MEDGKIILFQGDSVTDCNRMRETEQTWNKMHRMGDGYAFIVKAELNARHPEKDYKILNKGMAGNRLRDLFARIQDDAISYKPDILSILIGINEVWCKINANGVCEPKRFEAVYRLMLEEIKDKLPDTKIVLLEPFTVPAKEMKDGYDAWRIPLEPLQEVIARLASEFDCIYVPLQQKMLEMCKLAEPEHWLWDGIHATEAGHRIIADEWLNACKDIL